VRFGGLQARDAEAEEATGAKGLAGVTKALARFDLVAWGGIEPPTQGFSIPPKLCLTPLKRVDRIHINQQLSVIELDRRTATVLIGIHQNSAKVATWWLHGINKGRKWQDHPKTKRQT
jgi:hypothetical protein